MKRDLSQGGLYENGAVDPSRWRPSFLNTSRDRHAPGDLVGWRYGGWRVLEVRPIPDSDLTEEDLARLDKATAGYRPELRGQQREINRPRHLVLCHESGPLLLGPGWKPQRLHDGRVTLHFAVWGRSDRMPVVPEPYHACSCHGHIWPCQEIDQAQMAAHAAAKMDRALMTAEPGVCAGCLEPISTRQQTVTFPEESRLVPGMRGPTFHAGRAACWGGAEKYERDGRLVDNPDVVRLASCPGIQFVHEARGLPSEKRVECTAGEQCSGRHGPAGYRASVACWHRIQYGVLAGVAQHVRPLTDCGYRAGPNVCLGSVIDGSSATDAVAGDALWASRSGGRIM